MKLLAWDTSSKAGALVALEWDPKLKSGWSGVKLLSEWTLNVDSTHSDSLLWGIHQMLSSVRWKAEDVDLFGVGIGPGSFTGLRIGVTTARTFAHTLKKPLIGVSSLAALARPVARAFAEKKSGVVMVAATDACKGELFALWGAARSVADCVVEATQDGPGLWKRGVLETVTEPESLMRQVKRKLGASPCTWIAVGEGRTRYPAAWKMLPASREIQAPGVFPDQVQGRYLGQLVWEAYQSGLASEALLVHPRYLRVADAELKLKAGLLPAGPTRA